MSGRKQPCYLSNNRGKVFFLFLTHNTCFADLERVKSSIFSIDHTHLQLKPPNHHMGQCNRHNKSQPSRHDYPLGFSLFVCTLSISGIYGDIKFILLINIITYIQIYRLAPIYIPSVKKIFLLIPCIFSSGFVQYASRPPVALCVIHSAAH